MAPNPPPRRGDAKASVASKEQNIYIPEFISKRPFYAGEGDDSGAADYLEHQRIQKGGDAAASGSSGDVGFRERVKKVGPASTKFRKGACENCGAMTHKARDCLGRPRAKGAKWTGKDIQADVEVAEGAEGWDAKRDRWKGYDPREYRKVVEDYNRMEELRREARELAKKEGGGGDGDDDDEEADEEGDKYAEEVDMGKHQSTATRQLRLREDTAKYLLNLDLESAKYDPKTRTMVDAGAAASTDRAAALFAEEGFLRASGDASAFELANRQAWEAQERSGDTGMHLQANPTAGAHQRKIEAERERKEREDREKELLDKYGVAENSLLMPEALRQLAATESERFVEYDEGTGAVKGLVRAPAKSKYAEDVYVGNHTAVWGSWWSNFRWGYACCHSLVKKSYCTGAAGRQGFEEAEKKRTGVDIGEGGRPDAEEEDAPMEEDVVVDHDEAETEAVPKKVPEAKKRTREEMMGGVTEAELDAYRRKRTAVDDPMAKLLGKDELVH